MLNCMILLVWYFGGMEISHASFADFRDSDTIVSCVL